MNPHLPQHSREELSNTSSVACVLSIIQIQISYEFVLSMNNEVHLHQCKGIPTALAPFSGHFPITIMWIPEQDSSAPELGCFCVSAVCLTILTLNVLPQLPSTDNPHIQVRMETFFLAKQEEISGL